MLSARAGETLGYWQVPITSIYLQALAFKAENLVVEYAETVLVKFEVPNGDPAMITYGYPDPPGQSGFDFDATTTAFGETRSDGYINAPDEAQLFTQLDWVEDGIPKSAIVM